MKRFLTFALVLIMVVVFAAPAFSAAAADTTLNLKGESKGSFNEVWKNIIYLGGTNENTVEYQVWHIVYSGDLCVKKSNPPVLTGEVKSMQLMFVGNEEPWIWDGKTVSINAGGNNYGWIVVAPLGWELASGNFVTGSQLVTSNSKAQFNISNYNKYENPFVIIEKKWADLDGKILKAGPEGVVALFDIYTKVAFDNNGDPEYKDIIADVKTKVVPGTYVIAEKPLEGYVAQAPVTVVATKMNTTYTGSFTNKPEAPGAKLSFEKKVEGENIVDWLAAKGVTNITEILAGLKFSLVGTGINGRSYSCPSASPDPDKGIVVCDKLYPGSYVLSEEVTGAAIDIFTEMADIAINIAEGENKVFVIDGAVKGNIEGADFNDSDKFTIVNGYGSPKHMSGLGYPGLNNGGDLFFIGVKDVATGTEYASFCAHGGSRAFAGESGLDCGGYVVVQRAGMADLENREMAATYDKILAGLNWIQDNVGDLRAKEDSEYGWVSTARVVAQTVIWALLGNIDVDSKAFAETNLTDEERASVFGALAAAKEGYFGEIVDLVYMVCENHHDFNNCQPQLVPIFGKFFVENKPISGGGLGIDDASTANVSFNKTKYGGLLPVGADEFAFELYKMNTEEGSYDSLVGTYKTAQGGLVTATGLAPGEYVFREKWAVDHTTGYDDDEHAHYSNVWKATYPCDDDTCVFSGGLFFTINAKGDAIWPECYDLDETGAPMVNNEHYCKHAVLWSDTPFDLYGDPESGNKTVISCFEYEGGWITIIGGDCGNNSVYVHEIQVASCTLPGKIEFRCNTCTFRFAIDTSPVLDHDYECLKPEWQWLGLDENGEDLYGLFDIWKCTLCGKYDRQRIE